MIKKNTFISPNHPESVVYFILEVGDKIKYIEYDFLDGYIYMNHLNKKTFENHIGDFKWSTIELGAETKEEFIKDVFMGLQD